jgi:hypothetical protein
MKINSPKTRTAQGAAKRYASPYDDRKQTDRQK